MATKSLPPVATKIPSKLDWKLNASTGDYIANLNPVTRLVRSGREGKFLYHAQYWGDYSRDFPIGSSALTASKALEDLKKDVAKLKRRPSGHHATKKSSKQSSYDTSTSAGQKRLMQESVGLEYVPPRRIDASPGDYGADPIGPDEAGVFRWRMVPSGDIVDKTEHDRRLSPRGKRHHATKKSPAQLQREIDETLAGLGLPGTRPGKENALEYAQRRANATRTAYAISKMGHVMLADSHNKRLMREDLGGIALIVKPSR